MDSELSRLFDFAESNSKGSKSYGFVLSVKRQVLKTGFVSDKQRSVLLKIANSSTLLDLQTEKRRVETESLKNETEDVK